MTTPLTKQDFDKGIETLATEVRKVDKKVERLENTLDGADTRLTASISGLNQNFTKSQAAQDEKLTRIETAVNAMLEEVSTRKELRNLVHELKVKGIQLDETKIFA